MSIWYQLDVSVSGTPEAIAKFFNLDPKTDVRIENFEFSFGQKNAPGLRLGKIVEQNPDLIFLVKQSIECDTVQFWAERFDEASGTHQHIWLQDSGEVIVEVNKKALENYFTAYPYMREAHAKKKRPYDWDHLFGDFTRAADMLSRFAEYKGQMVSEMSEEDRHDDASPGMEAE